MTQATLEAQATCANCSYYQSRQDGTNKGWCRLFDIFARESHAQTQDCINTIVDEQAIAQQERNEYLEAQANAIAPEIETTTIAATANSVEIDSVYDPDFGVLYRVWRAHHLQGTFYRALGDSKWVAQPVGSDLRPRLNTPEQAQLVILSVAIDDLKRSLPDRRFCPASFAQQAA